MSCLSGAITLVGDFSASIDLVWDVSADVEVYGAADISILPEGGSSAAFTPIGGTSIDFGRGSASEMELEPFGNAEMNLSGNTSVMDMERKGRLVASLFREGVFNALFSWFTDISAAVEQVCSVNTTQPYLEIEPQFIWVVDGWAANDVLSNTHWNVD